MEDKRRNSIIRAVIFLSIVVSGRVWCEEIITVTDENQKYYLSKNWEFASLGPFTAFEITDENKVWNKVTLPFRNETESATKNEGYLLRTHFSVSKNIRDHFIGLYTGLMIYSCSFYINGICIGTLGSPEPDEYPGGLWDTFMAFFIPGDIIRYGEDNILIVKINENYPVVKFNSMFISSRETTQKSFFLDHFKFKILQFLAAFISISIFFPLIYFYLKNRKEIYALYIFLASLLYGCYGILASFNIPFFSFSLYYGITRICLSLGLTLIVLAIHSYYSNGNGRTWPGNLLILINVLATSVFFFLPGNALKRDYHSIHSFILYVPQVAYSIFIVFYNQVKKKEKINMLSVGMIILFASAFCDIVFDSLDARPSLWLSPIGVIVFSMSLFLAVANKYVADVKTAAHNAIKLQFAEALLGEKERLAVTLNSIGDAVICTDTKGVITLFNKAAEELTGFATGSVMLKYLSDVLLLEKENEEEDTPKNAVEALLCFHDPVPNSPVPYSLKRCDDRCHSVLLTKALIKDRANRTIGLVWVFHDITEREKLEKINRRNQTLESLGLLASGIAHDFNNIFMGILLNTGLVKRMNAPCDAPLDELLTGVEHAVTKASQLTNQLLTFARGGAPLILFRDIRPLVMASAGYASDGSGIRIDYNFATDLWQAKVDAGQMSQVIFNLVLNSIQALRKGGQIGITGENYMAVDQTADLDKGPYTLIKITDNGIGIKRKHLNKIFDPYFTTKQSGSGLGLTSVLSILEKHGAHIDVTSKENEGTTISIYLHAKADGEDEGI